MSKSVLITLTEQDLEEIIIRSVNAALKLNNMSNELVKQSTIERTPITIEKACEITGLAKPTIYYLAPKGLIPSHKRGKRLYFFEDELISWIKSGRKDYQTEIKREDVNG